MVNYQTATFVLFFVLVSTVSLSRRSSAAVTAENEKTLDIIKADGILGNYSSIIKETIHTHGFSISQKLLVQLNEDAVKSFYSEHSSKSFFSSLVEYMTSGPVLLMVLEKGNAVDDWRALIGPTDRLNAKATHPQRVMWAGFAKKLYSWFKLTSICCPRNIFFL